MVAPGRLGPVNRASNDATLDSVLRARLLGVLEVERDGDGIDSPVSQRPWALFAYLALVARPVSRVELANRFWPDVLDQSARASLRSALWTLRRQLGEAVVVEGERVGLRDGDVWVDVREFERLSPDDPEQALALCRGDLLEGLEHDWALMARDRHRERVIELLEELAQAAERDGGARRAIDLTRRQVECDPFDEDAHRRLIGRLDGAGDRAGAIRTYRSLAQRLRRELGVAPSALTRELAEQLRVGQGPPPAGGTAGDAEARDAEARDREGPDAEARRAAGRDREGPDAGAGDDVTRAAVTGAAGLLPLAGRDRELVALRRAWDAVKSGRGATAIVRGEAGIGKTRLATELRLQAAGSGGRVASCAPLDLGGSAPLSLWAELIGGLAPALTAPPAEAAWPEDLAVLAPELSARFARDGTPSPVVAPDLQRTRLFEAVVALLAWATRDAAVLLVFEDVHGADGPSLELAGYVARRAAGLRVMMLFTRRELPHSVDADRLEHALRARRLLACELDLGPLPAESLARLAHTAARLSDAEVERVVRRAEGNPLLAVETARGLGRGGPEAVAPSLRGSVRATLGPLSADGRRLVEIAAVAGRPLADAELDSLPLADPEEAAAEALETGMLLALDGGLAFRHALLREAVYQEIAEPRRRGLHLRWARALVAAQEDGDLRRPAEIARQLRLAGDDAGAVPHLARAAANARAVAALEQACAYLSEALEIASARVDLWLELGDLEAWRGRRHEAETAFRTGLALLEGGDPLDLARGWLRRARAYHGPICVPRAVLESARIAIELLDHAQGSAAAERSEALAACAWAEAVAGSVAEAERLLAQLSAPGAQTDDLRTYDAGHARALALMRRGRFVDSYAPSIAAGEAIARASRPDLSYGCWANAASAAMAAGEHDRALEFLDRGMAAVAGHGLQSLEIHLLGARSFVLSGAGRLAQARATAEHEQALAAQLAQPGLLAMSCHDCGVVALLEGDDERAASLLADALVDGAPVSRPLTRLALAEALVRCGDPDGAAQQVRATVLEPVGAGDFPSALVPRLARVQGLIARARGDPEEAQRRIEEAIAGWERLLGQTIRAESITSVLADLGRPVVGLVEPERELARARSDLHALRTSAEREPPNAVVS